MSELDDIFSSYKKLRNVFCADAAAAKSESLRKLSIQAVVAADVCFSIIELLPVSQEGINAWTMSRLQDINDRLERNVENADQGAIFPEAALTIAASLNNQFKVVSAQSEYLTLLVELWLSSLGDLFDDADDNAFLEKIEIIMSFVAGRLPGVGDVLDILKLAAELYAARKLRREAADKHLAKIENFVEDSYIWLAGAFAFIALTRKLGENIEPVSDEEIRSLIEAHFDNVKTKFRNSPECS